MRKTPRRWASNLFGQPIKCGKIPKAHRPDFAFDDISKVAVKLDQGANDLAGTENKKPPFAFGFDARQAAPLHYDSDARSAAWRRAAASGGDADKAQAAQALAMMEDYDEGRYVDVTLNVNGRPPTPTRPSSTARASR